MPTQSTLFGPRPRMLPPEGCRAAVGGWPQLAHAIAGFPAGAAELGGPLQLMAALGADGALLAGDRPPADIYSAFVWLVSRLWSAAETMGAALAQLPAILSAPGGNDEPPPAPALVELLTGSRGLAQICGAIATAADALEQRVSRANATYGSDAALAAVLGNLSAVLQSTGVEWRTLGAELTAVPAQATPAQLGDLDYLLQTFDIDSAARNWSHYARAVQDYVQRLLLPDPC